MSQLLATAADKALKNEVIIAKVASGFGAWDWRMFTFVGQPPRHGDVAAFHLGISRGRVKATVFVLPPDRAPQTEIWVTTGRPTEGSRPVAQFRDLCFYREAASILEQLRSYEPDSHEETLHFIALFDGWVKDGIRRKKLTVTERVEKIWHRYTLLRSRYLLMKDGTERDGAKTNMIRLARTFLVETGTTPTPTPNGRG